MPPFFIEPFDLITFDSKTTSLYIFPTRDLLVNLARHYIISLCVISIYHQPSTMRVRETYVSQQLFNPIENKPYIMYRPNRLYYF